MSKFKPGDMVTKAANAGFLGAPEPLCRIPEGDLSQGAGPCFLCEEEGCTEWPNLEILSASGEVVMGYAYHVSECQMTAVSSQIDIVGKTVSAVIMPSDEYPERMTLCFTDGTRASVDVGRLWEDSFLITKIKPTVVEE